MSIRYFKQDKNYILQEAQHSIRDELLLQTIHCVNEQILIHENPMGLEDDFIRDLRNSRVFNIVVLEEFYDTVAAIYRLLYSNNQLQFIWDGKSHQEHYRQEWVKIYKEWIKHFCNEKGFRRAILKACILEPMANHNMLKPHIFKVVQNRFPVRITRYKKLVKVA